jgi:porin
MKKFSFFIIAFFYASCAFAASDNTAITSDQYFIPELCPNSHIQPMTGNWQGTRTELAQRGVTFESSYVMDLLGDVVGGMMQGARYCHSMGWDVNFDLEKFAGLVGTQFHISGLWRAGQNLSSAVIGNALTASSIYGHQQFRLYGLYLEKTFLKNALNIRAGRIATGDDFAASEIYWNFVQNSIDGNPISIPINLFFPTYPTAVWGARAKLNITKDLYTITGIYNGDPNVQRDSAYGCDFSLRLSEGLIFAQEIAYTPNVSKECPLSALPGHYKAGFYYNGATFFDQYTSEKYIGNYGVYFHADQMIYKKNGSDCNEGLTPFIVITLAPDNLNKFPFFIDGGLVYKGLVPTRKHDIASIGFAYGKYSTTLANAERDSHSTVQGYECVFDFSYKVEITPWMFLQPDMQYIVNPSGGKNIDDAFVVGTRFGLTF